jgi:hypothetical protein
MTISLTDNSPRIAVDFGSITVGQTHKSFTVSFEFFDAADLNVYINGTLKTLTTHYTVTGGNGSTGTISLSTAGISVTDKVVITRDIALARTTDFPTSGPFDVTSLNLELDKFIAISADLKDQASRALQLTDFDVNANLTLPALDDRKGRVLAFNSTTGESEAGPSIGDVSSISAITADISRLADIEDGTNATNAIQTVASISSNVTAVNGIASNVTTVAGISADVTAVAGVYTDVTTVAGINTQIGLLGTADAVADMNTLGTADVVLDMNTLATASNVTNMNTLAGINGDITTVSGIQANVTAVAGDEADIGNVATNIANVNTVAGIDGNVTTVAGIHANVTTVAGIQANVTTVASNDANVTAVAGNATNINTVAGQATNLQNVTDNLSNIQNAAQNATAASASQIAAAASAAALAGALDNFADTYLGTMTDTDTASSASTTSTFVLGSSALTVADATGIEIGQNVSATGIPSNANVISIDGTTVTLSHVSTAAGSSVATTFQGYGVFGAFNSNIDGPDKDNDNGNLVTGALYYNSTDGEMRVYDGANWIAASAAGSASMIVYEYTATAGQDTFTGSDDNSASLSYVAGNIQVVMNGIVLDPDDFTATNGTSVVLTSDASLNDVVNIYAFKSFTVADTVSASAGGTFVGNVDFNSGIDVTGTVNATSFVGSGASLTGVEAFPAGTKMLFGQTAAPTGWTKITTDDDAALRIVSGTVGTGGSVGLSTALATPTVTGTIAGSTGNHTLTTAQMPSHRHSITTKAYNGNNTFNLTAFQYNNGAQNTGEVTNLTGGGGSHSHSLSATFSSGTATINVKYVDTIMASKD